MNASQEIKLNRILKKLEDAKKELKVLLYEQGYDPLTHAEYDTIESALTHVNNAINCL